MTDRNRCFSTQWRICVAVALVVLVPGIGFGPLWADDQPDVPGYVGPGVPEGYMVIEGDIIVPLNYYKIQTTFATNLWSGGVIPYEFDGNVDGTNRTRMLNAMVEWEAVANVDFRPRDGHDNYIYVQADSVNTSSVGMQGGKQTVKIVSWGSHFTIVHELGHALGYWHEQSRADRDSYVTINWGRICQDCCSGDPCDHNFEIRPAGSAEYGPYDFDSVMHYGQCDFSVCGGCAGDPDSCRTITVRPAYAQWQDQIGQRGHLSHFDQLTMSFLYPQSSWRFVQGSHAGLEVGTFLYPYRQFTTGAALIPAHGTLWVQPGYYSAVGTYNRAMTIKAPLGNVTLGG